MINRKHKLSVRRQAALLGISRVSVYYLQRQVPEADLALMLRDLLAGEGLQVGRLTARCPQAATLAYTGTLSAPLPLRCKGQY